MTLKMEYGERIGIQCHFPSVTGLLSREFSVFRQASTVNGVAVVRRRIDINIGSSTKAVGGLGERPVSTGRCVVIACFLVTLRGAGKLTHPALQKIMQRCEKYNDQELVVL